MSVPKPPQTRPMCKCGAFACSPKPGRGILHGKPGPDQKRHTATECDADPIALEHRAARIAGEVRFGLRPAPPEDPSSERPRIFKLSSPNVVTVKK